LIHLVNVLMFVCRRFEVQIPASQAANGSQLYFNIYTQAAVLLWHCVVGSAEMSTANSLIVLV